MNPLGPYFFFAPFMVFVGVVVGPTPPTYGAPLFSWMLFTENNARQKGSWVEALFCCLCYVQLIVVLVLVWVWG
jgi:hypothetical protein